MQTWIRKLEKLWWNISAKSWNLFAPMRGLHSHMEPILSLATNLLQLENLSENNDRQKNRGPLGSLSFYYAEFYFRRKAFSTSWLSKNSPDLPVVAYW